MADGDDTPRHGPAAIEEDHIGRLRAPIFSGEEDLEQFITEFSDVAAICQ